jgi:hypothetical protein
MMLSRPWPQWALPAQSFRGRRFADPAWRGVPCRGAVRTDIRARPALRNKRFAAGAACRAIRAVKDS